ncbi:MAG: hypothetical protein FWH48_04150, partial [Oscillospiraceae bacterium]|nr:hypothetical protein [Oscillospiraceae bacterium]
APRNDYFNGRVMNYSLYASTDGGASYSAIVENVSVDENISYVTGSDYLVITLPKTTPMNVLKLTVNESLEPTVIISNIEIYADSSYDFSAAPEPPAESPAEPEAPAVVNPPSSPTGDNMAIIFALMLCVICAFIAIKTKHPLKTK